MDPADLSALNYFLDVVRIDPKKVGTFARVAKSSVRNAAMRGAPLSEDLLKAIDTIEQTVAAIPTLQQAADLASAKAAVLETVDQVKLSKSGVERTALDALRGALAR
jgi:hypothetical protein